MDESKLSFTDEWNCDVLTSFEVATNKSDYSWDVFEMSIQDNLLDMHIKLHGKPYVEFFMTESWINVYKQHHSQEVHTHSGGDGCTFSCAYFVQYDPEQDGKFGFYNPSQDMHVGDYSKHYPTNSTWFPDVKEGDILIFPSTLHHFVQPQRTTHQRVTVSANFRLKTKI
ncbi:putative 2OG-Fe(II) oxygenase [Synechococcus phage S-SZBM1]|uniref:2OG-Fe(II) oxygenase n=1 Tax=Synechococcus phage S-SZBM1 TaxID=2926475 RepID=A0AC61TSF5_9CAUD|nr:2OG-Fe(II) oxygenase [Synechococcus phage S-SZBM1]UNH61149.1 putative 2OG-Fe(II) oxygenase [Synechococcus phage S-SZBM1]